MVSRMAKTGLGLSLIGAALDFISGSLMVQMQPMSMDNGMGMQSTVTTATTWAVLLYLLGVILVVTGVFGVLRVGMRRMNIVGSLMSVYGIIMILIGMAMIAGISPAMQGAMFSGIGMLVVGIAMIVNGAIMINSRRGRKAGG